MEYLIDTDIIIEHLAHTDAQTESVLEKLMTHGVCFTTVVNASELYFAASSEEEKRVIDAVMKALKVLGINSRYSLNISEFFNKVATTRDALICTVAKINKLPLVTNNMDKYKESGITIINPKEL
ncbi:MAG: PIN domain-containing protein [Ignavibacteriales bacterium]|nr:PIN domain-containing protein [Ignavibacteriales bacterium]